MKINHFITAISITVLSAAASASGTHSGGHDKDKTSDKASKVQAIGKAGKASKVTRTINVDMTDAMRFIPASIDAKQGETIKFIVKNSGNVRHEMNIGTMKDLMAHAEQMKKNPGMEHDEPNVTSLAPGKTGEIIWQFTTAGSVDFACLQAGHFDAGMKGAVSVAKR